MREDKQIPADKVLGPERLASWVLAGLGGLGMLAYGAMRREREFWDLGWSLHRCHPVHGMIHIDRVSSVFGTRKEANQLELDKVHLYDVPRETELRAVDMLLKMVDLMQPFVEEKDDPVRMVADLVLAYGLARIDAAKVASEVKQLREENTTLRGKLSDAMEVRD